MTHQSPQLRVIPTKELAIAHLVASHGDQAQSMPGSVMHMEVSGIQRKKEPYIIPAQYLDSTKQKWRV